MSNHPQDPELRPPVAHDWPEKDVIRGKVQKTRVEVWMNSLCMISTNDMPEEDYPKHFNNMGPWLVAAYKLLTPELKRHILDNYQFIQREVNGGLGRRTGKESSENVFTYRISTPAFIMRIDVTIWTRRHQAIQAQKIRQGLHTPTPKAYNPFERNRIEPWFSTDLNKYIYPNYDAAVQNIRSYDAYHVFKNFAEECEAAGKLRPEESKIERFPGLPKPSQRINVQDDAEGNLI